MCARSTTSKLIRLLSIATALMVIMTGICSAAAWEDDEVVGSTGIILKASGKGEATASECTLGAAVADALKDAAETDIAIVCGGDLYRNLLPGECTWSDIQATFSNDPELGVATVTAAQLFELLEYSVSFATLVDDTRQLDYEASQFYGFPQISGFTLEYDMSGQSGDRVYLVELDDGTRIYATDDITLTVCASLELLSGTYGHAAVAYTPLEMTQTQAFAQYIAAGMIDSSFDGTGRIYALSTTDNSIVARYPLVIALAIVILIMIAFAPMNKRRFEKRREGMIAAVWNEAHQREWEDLDSYDADCDSDQQESSD